MTEEYCTELGKVGKTESTGYPNEKKMYLEPYFTLYTSANPNEVHIQMKNKK